MLKDVDLDAQTVPEGWREEARRTAHSKAHSTPSQAQAPVPATNRRRTMRGKLSIHFHVKRPRRNVVKRSISSLAQLENIEEEKETLLGIDMNQKRADDGRDPYRAPRMAFVLFLLVCSAVGYRSFNEYWITRNDAAFISTMATNKDTINAEDVTKSFRGSSDGEHRGALLQTTENLENGISQEGNITSQNIEDIPTLLFDDTIVAPEQLSNLANIFQEPYNPLQNKLFLWHIPRSGSTTIIRIASYCLGLTIASEAGKSEVASGSQELRIVEGLDGIHFANVDTSNPQGIERAKSLDLGQSEQVDLVSSPYLWDLAGIFDEVHKGYMVAMFRHPIERAASLYYSMRKNPQYEKQVGSLLSIEQYAKSSLVENNWMTRFLSNTLSGELTPEHEAIAKEVLRTKCLIGLLSDKTETMKRLKVFFNFKSVDRTQRREECQEKLLYWDWPGKNRHELVVQGSEAWDTLYKQNTFDLRLYEYAVQLFGAQGKLFDEAALAW
eukprot:CAMPEP_0181100888 /NCGR_PEP_ID=MMETSP1071-20121207/13446_1 /TAXON_ID=35127 /ORGANISM="Thalassiosira sp., Strain NH16" /LENGTH=496 /DNA_ID=CAMNT_0023183673 /DNA_START=99 /DNA_END=1586 /DNA_ORIENTATION=-